MKKSENLFEKVLEILEVHISLEAALEELEAIPELVVIGNVVIIDNTEYIISRHSDYSLILEGAF